MEPRVQYAQCEDGVSIAYWTLGDGDPFVYAPIMPFSHIQLEWGIPDCRRWYELLAAGRQLVRYDGRGSGLSDRDAADFTLEAQLLDLSAVVDKLGLERFVLFGSADPGMTAIAYAAQNPDRVSHLILWCTWARRADVSASPRTKALRALLDQDWDIYTETVARALLGWQAEAEARQLASFYRQCTSPEVLRRIVEAAYDTDVSALLPDVQCPTLVLHRRELPAPELSVVKGLAKQIPNGSLALLEGSSPIPFMEDMGAILTATHEFLGDTGSPALDVPDTSRTAPVTIIFTDIAGSTGLTQRLGDDEAQEVLRIHNTIVRETLKAHAGTEIKHTGDGVMASFRSAAAAVDFSIVVQQRVRAHAESEPDRAFDVRIGVNAGEPVAEDHDLFGTAVQLARRICDEADSGQVLVSDVVRGLTAGKGFVYSDTGQHTLRGFEEPARLYEVRWWE
ncbi:MAG TPA: adenylate/guanylate cyclase domain-containing protein [Dehalococcoidia bacterium]